MFYDDFRYDQRFILISNASKGPEDYDFTNDYKKIISYIDPTNIRAKKIYDLRNFRDVPKVIDSEFSEPNDIVIESPEPA